MDSIDDFKYWLEDLDLQTLTDELKDEIFTRVEIVVLNEGEGKFNEGLEEGIETF